MPSSDHDTAVDTQSVQQQLDRAIRAIPPLWPLSSSVAVNPFIGQAHEFLAQTATRLSRIADISITMSRTWFRQRIADGTIQHCDLAAAWSNAPARLRPPDLSALQRAILAEPPQAQSLPTISELAANLSGTDWPGLVSERLGAWAASYFDEGQALWPTSRGKSAYASWRWFAVHDVTPEIAGLTGFARHIAEAPECAITAIYRSVETLGLPREGLETYFHQLLLGLGGWAQYARYKLWQAELSSTSDNTITDLLAARLLWEEALFIQHREQVTLAWSNVCWHHAQPVVATAETVVDAILQNALERASQRELAKTMAQPSIACSPARPDIQAAFCIDVRSEVFRRALESLGANIQTKGFAGFFGLTIQHHAIASDIEERRLPVLLNPGLFSRTGADDREDSALRIKRRAVRAWDRFRMAAVSSFAFVEGSGPLYAGKLLRDALALPRKPPSVQSAPQLDPLPNTSERVEMAAKILGAMSLTHGFAPLVLLLGHGASVVNNPHASALQCGACGGHAGDVNSRVLADMLNDPAVRTGLAARGISVPEDTLFLAGLHDTTTDSVRLFQESGAAADLEKIAFAQDLLNRAAIITREERAGRLAHGKSPVDVFKRSRDWAQTRPEWGLAGCSAFIAAPRSRTRGKNLQGHAFLHDYDWRRDTDFKVLELILTAPVVVASWISLQYYGSAVAPQIFGAGNKLLHNVTGGIGVLEGNGGCLRAGLPWQSVHDGNRLVHQPLRLTVCVEAPREEITNILARHVELKNLFDHGWLHLFGLDDQGRMTSRYAGELEWCAFDEMPAGLEAA